LCGGLFATLCRGKLHATSPRVTYNFNPGWKFIREDVTNAEQVAFDDSKWTTSARRTLTTTWIPTPTSSATAAATGIAYGHRLVSQAFQAAGGAKDGKVFLEFEGLKQAGRFWVNGKFAGKFENGVTPCGLDLTGFVNFGDADNVIAVKVDNSNDYKEEATGAGFEWMGRAFNPNYGGLNHDIWLHLTGKVYQTLPLYENLKTDGRLHLSVEFFHQKQNLRREPSNRRCATNPATSNPSRSRRWSWMRTEKSARNFQSDASDLVSGQTEISPRAAGWRTQNSGAMKRPTFTTFIPCSR
jgi:hypothetical protein